MANQVVNHSKNLGFYQVVNCVLPYVVPMKIHLKQDLNLFLLTRSSENKIEAIETII